jgi:hypothetical protein
MRIESEDRRSSILLDRRDESGFLVLSVEASISDFTARSRSIIIEHAASFLRQLDGLEATRQGEALLQGIEDGFELRLRTLNSTGHLWIGIRMTRRDNPEPLQFSGGFPIDSDHSVTLFAGLRQLLTPTMAAR